MSDTPGPIEPFLVPGLLQAARFAKERATVFVPILAWESLDGEAGFLVIPPQAGSIAEVLDELLTVMRDMYGPPRWFAITVDAYGRYAQASEPIEPADLAERFVTGDMSVVEQLMVLVGSESRASVWRQVYRHTPVDGWEWDEPQYMADPVMPDPAILDIVAEHSAAATGP